MDYVLEDARKMVVFRTAYDWMWIGDPARGERECKDIAAEVRNVFRIGGGVSLFAHTPGDLVMTLGVAEETLEMTVLRRFRDYAFRLKFRGAYDDSTVEVWACRGNVVRLVPACGYYPKVSLEFLTTPRNSPETIVVTAGGVYDCMRGGLSW